MSFQDGETYHDNGAYFSIADCDCVHNARVYGLRESIRRAKFPMSVKPEKLDCELTKGIEMLAKSRSGEGHDQWLTGVVVQFDLTFSNKAWVEAERYHFLDFVSSQSTMHRIARFDIDKVYNEYVDPRIIDIMRQKADAYNEACQASENAPEGQEEEYEALKTRRYLELLYSNPAGFKITAGMTTNYRQLKTIYAQRHNHRLPEWRAFCRWIETLPNADLITQIPLKATVAVQNGAPIQFAV